MLPVFMLYVYTWIGRVLGVFKATFHNILVIFMGISDLFCWGVGGKNINLSQVTLWHKIASRTTHQGQDWNFRGDSHWLPDLQSCGRILELLLCIGVISWKMNHICLYTIITRNNKMFPQRCLYLDAWECTVLYILYNCTIM